MSGVPNQSEVVLTNSTRFAWLDENRLSLLCDSNKCWHHAELDPGPAPAADLFLLVTPTGGVDPAINSCYY